MRFERPHANAEAMMLAAIVVSGLVIGFVILLAKVEAHARTIERNSGRIERNTRGIARIVRDEVGHERADTADLRAISYRICARQMEVRAAIIIHVGVTARHGALTDATARHYAAERDLIHALPIFDCSPDKIGHRARLLSDAEAFEYLRHFDHRGALAPP